MSHLVPTAIAAALLAAACGRTCPASNASSVTTMAIGRIGAPREALIARSGEELSALFAKAASSNGSGDTPAARAAFIDQTDFRSFDVVVVNIDGVDDFQGTLRNGPHPDVAPFFDGPDDEALVALVGPHCGPVDDPTCGPQHDVVVIPRAIVFRLPKGKKIRVLRCAQNCPSKCGPHS